MTNKDVLPLMENDGTINSNNKIVSFTKADGVDNIC